MRQGFSLIELIVVISIVAIISMAAWPSFKRFSCQPILNFSTLAVASEVRSAQARAYATGLSQQAHGIYFAASGNPIPGKFGTIIVNKTKKVIVSNCGRVRIE